VKFQTKYAINGIILSGAYEAFPRNSHNSSYWDLVEFQLRKHLLTDFGTLNIIVKLSLDLPPP